MALSNAASTLSSKSLHQSHSLFSPSQSYQLSSSLVPTGANVRSLHPITAVHSAEPAKNPVVADKPVQKSSPTVPAASDKWTVDSWKSKKALQLPEYPNESELESVLRTIDAFPPIVFAGEARSLEERLADAAMGNAFLLQGGDCAESFKEFSANNIRDTFRVILQMSAVLMFGSQMPVIKVRSLLDFQFVVCYVNYLVYRISFSANYWV